MVQIRPAQTLDWTGLLEVAVRHGAAIAGFAADALRAGRYQVWLVAQANGVSLDIGPAAGTGDCPPAASHEHE